MAERAPGIVGAMDADTIYTLIGYAGSLLVIVSLSMTSVLKLRLIGLAGSLTFLVYGLLIGATPVVVTNVVIVGIHSFYLYRAWTDRDYFSVLAVYPASRYLAEFFDFYSEDIDRFFPGFAYRADDEALTVLVLRNMVPAGAFVGRPAGDAGVLEVDIDYAIPRYRDFKLGKYLFETRADFFTSKGWNTLQAVPTTTVHARYLARMGFESAGDGRYRRSLT
jgi:hypothetical protein